MKKEIDTITLRAAAIIERSNRFFYRWNPECQAGRIANLILDNRKIRDSHSWALSRMAETSRILGFWECDKAKAYVKDLKNSELREIGRI